MTEKKKEEKTLEEFEEIVTIPRSLEEGESITGTYVGMRQGKFGNIIILDGLDGKVYNIYSSVQLDTILTPSQLGKVFRITYKGKEKTSKGMWVRTYKISRKRE